MKRICLALLLLIGLASCGETPTNRLTIKGEIKGLGTDTLYIYGADMMYNRTDTLFVEDDEFSLILDMDTLIWAWLEFSDKARYPLFLDKGKTLMLKGVANDVEAMNVTGSVPNEELTAFRKELRGLTTSTEALLQQRADSFIRNHPASLASAYLLDKYFVQVAEPDYDRIQTLINGMAGNLKDRPRINRLLELTRDMNRLTDRRQAPYLQLPNTAGKRINRSNFKDQYILVHFWASWNPASRQANADLRRIYLRENKSREKNFALWGISLDLNRREWERAIKRDTLEWEQSCDFLGWESQPVEQLYIQSLPANVLISPTGRIEGINLDADAIEEKLKEIKEKAKEKKKN